MSQPVRIAWWRLLLILLTLMPTCTPQAAWLLAHHSGRACPPSRPALQEAPQPRRGQPDQHLSWLLPQETTSLEQALQQASWLHEAAAAWTDLDVVQVEEPLDFWQDDPLGVDRR